MNTSAINTSAIGWIPCGDIHHYWVVFVGNSTGVSSAEGRYC